MLSRVWLFVTSWTVANHGQIPLSLEFCRQEYWSETGVSCHLHLQGIFLTEGLNPHLLHSCIGRQFFTSWATGEAQSESKSHSVVSSSLQPHRLYIPWNSPGQNAGVGSLSLLQGILWTQGLKPGLPYCRQFLYQLSHKGSPNTWMSD